MERLDKLLQLADKYLEKAVTARNNFTEGSLHEQQAAYRVGKDTTAAKVAYANSLTGKNQIAENRWHMAQSRTFALVGILEGIYRLVREQRRTNTLLEVLVMRQEDKQ